MKPCYQRIILKLSGEALMGHNSFGIDPSTVTRIVDEVAALSRLGVQIGIVVGGGNIFRGSALSHLGINRVTADHMGMLATVMNALALREAFENQHIPARVMSAIPMSGIVEHYDRRKAIHHLQQQRVVIFAAGTGNPLVTTDSAASLRAIEVAADILLKATNVDGVYNADPQKDPQAKRYQRLSYTEALQKELGVMDLGAFTQCRDYGMRLIVFSIKKAGALLKVVMGEDEGTLVENSNDE